MICDGMLEWMSAALDGELTADEKAQLDRHLAQCDHCRALFDDLSSIHDACEHLEVLPPPALRDQILSRLPSQKEPTKVIPIHWKRWGAMAASFVLIALAAWHLPKTVSHPPQSSEDITTVAPAQDVPETNDQVADALSDPVNDNALISPESIPAPTALFLPDDRMERSVDSSSTDGSKDNGERGVTNAPATSGGVVAAEFVPEQEQSEDAAFMHFSSRKAAAAPMQAIFATGETVDALSMNDADMEIPEPRPEMTDGEDLSATLFLQNSVPNSYCGILTLQSGVFLHDFPAQVQENGEIWYELPDTAFFALIEELTNANTVFTLRATGADVSASAQNGLVIILP